MNLSVLVSVLAFVAVIGPLIFVHELGHYLAGRLFGVQAEMFSIGMGRELFGWTDRRGTRWKVSALPIGGYVKFRGDMGPASTPDPAWQALPPEEKAKTLQAKPVWQRFLIVAAGPITNFAAAILIFILYFAVTGVPQTPAVVGQIAPDTPAAAAGLRPGDRIVRVAGRSVDRFEDMAEMIALRPRIRVDLLIDRGGRQLHVPVTPKAEEVIDPAGNKIEIGLLGVVATAAVNHHPGIAGVITEAFRETAGTVRTITDVVGQILGGGGGGHQKPGPPPQNPKIKGGVRQGTRRPAQDRPIFRDRGECRLASFHPLHGAHLD